MDENVNNNEKVVPAKKDAAVVNSEENNAGIVENNTKAQNASEAKKIENKSVAELKNTVAESGSVANPANEANNTDTGAASEVKKPKKKKKKKKLPKKVIEVDNLGVKFHIQEQKVDNLKEYFIRLVKRKLRYKEFWALRNVTFHIRKGDRVGILGLNGAGKSTLLKCIAGVLKPTEGSVTVKGNIVPLLELGAGFDKDYTGRENIFLYGSMLGYSKSFLKEKYSEIVEFSELGDFINVPVKNYSSGMKARLGFSIATVVEPEILILDEVLSVGDAKFRKKSSKKLQKMMKKGVTVLFVSHSADQVLATCNKAIILEHGQLVASGKAEKICKKYEKMISV